MMTYALECLQVLSNVASVNATQLYQFAPIGDLQKFTLA